MRPGARPASFAIATIVAPSQPRFPMTETSASAICARRSSVFDGRPIDEHESRHHILVVQPNNVLLRIDAALDANACAEVIGDATRRGFQETAIDYPPTYRDNDRLVITDEALARSLFERVRDRLPAE